jgi:hypothetical protein
MWWWYGTVIDISAPVLLAILVMVHPRMGLATPMSVAHMTVVARGAALTTIGVEIATCL